MKLFFSPNSWSCQDRRTARDSNQFFCVRSFLVFRSLAERSRFCRLRLSFDLLQPTKVQFWAHESSLKHQKLSTRLWFWHWQREVWSLPFMIKFMPQLSARIYSWKGKHQLCGSHSQCPFQTAVVQTNCKYNRLSKMQLTCKFSKNKPGQIYRFVQ